METGVYVHTHITHRPHTHRTQVTHVSGDFLCISSVGCWDGPRIRTKVKSDLLHLAPIAPGPGPSLCMPPLWLPGPILRTSRSLPVSWGLGACKVLYK